MSTFAHTFVSDFFAALNRHDIPSALKFFAPDAAYEDAALGVIKRGHEEIGKFFGVLFDCYANVHHTLHNAVGDEERIAWEWTLEANYVRTSYTGIAASGQKISVRGASFARFEGGRVVWHTDYWDIATMRRQIESKTA